MNAKMKHPLQIALACLALGLASSGAAAAKRCDSPAGRAELEACAKAKESADALRWYIQRTRALHGLHYWDFAPTQSQLKAAEQARAAQATGPAQQETARAEAATSK